MGAFGGGIASTGRVCGALLGGISLISSLYSRGNLDEQDDPRMWKLSSRLTKRFEEAAQEFGGIECRQIAGIDWRNREAVKDFYGNPESRRKHCVKVVGDTAFALGQLLEEDAAK